MRSIKEEIDNIKEKARELSDINNKAQGRIDYLERKNENLA